jgi:hypothetical protein
VVVGWADGRGAGGRGGERGETSGKGGESQSEKDFGKLYEVRRRVNENQRRASSPRIIKIFTLLSVYYNSQQFVSWYIEWTRNFNNF